MRNAYDNLNKRSKRLRRYAGYAITLSITAALVKAVNILRLLLKQKLFCCTETCSYGKKPEKRSSMDPYIYDMYLMGVYSFLYII